MSKKETRRAEMMVAMGYISLLLHIFLLLIYIFIFLFGTMLVNSLSKYIQYLCGYIYNIVKRG